MRLVRRQHLPERALRDAIRRAELGLVDADLGGGVIKQRVARPGQGKSGGYRVILAFRRERRAVFLYAFAKNERDNVDDDELATLRDLGKAWLNAGERDIERALADGILMELDHE
jgi:hypothetical protein